MSKSQPQPISELVQKVVEQLARERKHKTRTLAGLWRNVAGKDLARHSRALGIKKGTLQVQVEDSAWLYQTNLKKDEILAALQKTKGYEQIQQLQLRIGKT
ncbi:MAG: DUF721 domain-containing protein [Candidatus Omnitrophota bacterium]